MPASLANVPGRSAPPPTAASGRGRLRCGAGRFRTTNRGTSCRLGAGPAPLSSACSAMCGGTLLAQILAIPTVSRHLPRLVADHRGSSCVQSAPYPYSPVTTISQVAAIVVSVSAQGDVCHRQPKRPGFGAGGHQPQLKQKIVW